MGIILEKETFEKFGYKIEELKPCSCKLVIWKCEKCGTIFEKKYVYAKKFTLCLHCSNKEIARGSKDVRSERMIEYYKNHEHPLKGTKRPQHVVDALKKARSEWKMSEEQKNYYSKKYSGEGNPFYGKKHTEESLKKMSESSRKNTRRGRMSNFYGKIYYGVGSYYRKKDDKRIWMRSYWEIAYARYLDVNNIEWDYEPKAFEIVINGIEKTYTPDFFLIKENKFIEIKGFWRDESLIKFNTFRERYPEIEIEVLMKKDLRDLGILTYAKRKLTNDRKRKEDSNCSELL